METEKEFTILGLLVLIAFLVILAVIFFLNWRGLFPDKTSSANYSTNFSEYSINASLYIPPPSDLSYIHSPSFDWTIASNNFSIENGTLHIFSIWNFNQCESVNITTNNWLIESPPMYFGNILFDKFGDPVKANISFSQIGDSGK